jgi:UDP-N-acetylglucosamine 1-carboxyvinyltransferase
MTLIKTFFPILFASILADGPITLNNTPQLSDISTTLRLVMSMGADFILESNSFLFGYSVFA